MLRRLQIRDFATIDRVAVEFPEGMTVLTGETGAGKSILVDAIGLLLGDRGDAAWVRPGRERAELVAEFDLRRAAAARQWLEAQELADPDDPETCILRRTIAADGRSRAAINGSPVPIGRLREIGELLIDIHGQHEHQLLLRADAQRRLLDEYAGHAGLLQDVASQARRWQGARRERERLRAGAGRTPAELELLSYQLEELRRLGIGEIAIDELEAEHRELSHAGELLGRGSAVHEALSGDGGLDEQLARALHEIEALARFSPGLETVARLLADAQIPLREAADELQRRLSRIEVDEQRLAELERRMEDLHDAARKHRVRVEELPELAERLAGELADAETASGRLAELEGEIDDALGDWRAAAERLSASRRRAADELSERTSAVCAQLGMAGAQIRFEVEPEDTDQPSPDGADRVSILFTANPGQPPRPLARVASGGELSRVSLAIQVTASGDRSLPAMIFDEVDSGVGGAVAEIVGQRLRELSRGRQVLCVTHLPQVAARADHQIRISKTVVDGQTVSRVQPLTDAEREEELARMLGGRQITDAVRATAREMLAGD